MRFSIQIEASWSQGVTIGKEIPAMTDWIDAQKQKMQRQREDDTTAQKIRIHELDVIAVKAPVFWGSTVKEVAALAAKLKSEFPETEPYQLDYQSMDGGFSLTRRTHPTEYF